MNISKKVNNLMLSLINTSNQVCYSVDTVVDSEDAVQYPTEFLNSLIPSHKLVLKVGAPIILLRNLNPSKLCSGTRLQVKS